MKRVLIISLAWLPHVGGAEIAWHEITKRLKNQYDFTIMTSKNLGWWNKLLFLPVAVLKSLFIKTDLVIGILENQAALSARLISWIKGVPCIINLQSGDSEEYIYSKLGFFDFLYDQVYDKNSQYVVLSKYLEQRALEHGVPQKNLTIIPNGVDLQVFNNTMANKKFQIITSGRLEIKNDVETLISAFCVLQKIMPELKLVICGIGSQGAALKKQANNNPNIAFTGLVSHKELARLLNESLIFVRPSISEGFGNSFIEAMGCGVPIIGTNVGGIPDFLVHERTGLFCEPNNPKSLAKQIKRLLGDQDLYSSIQLNSQEFVKRFGWNNIAKKYAEVLG